MELQVLMELLVLLELLVVVVLVIQRGMEEQEDQEALVPEALLEEQVW